MPPTNEKICFVLMPFREDLKTVYTEAIKAACDKVGFKAVRANELIGPYNIHRDIIEYIFSSDAIVADLTDCNPNVFYELGVAHAIANKTIMIMQKGQKPPFDIHNYRCISYDMSEAGLRTLTKQIAEYLEHLAAWSQRPTNPVQEFKRNDVFLTPDEAEKLRRALRQKDELLKASALEAARPKAELEKLQREHQDLQRELHAQTQKTIAKTEWEALQKQLQARIAENAALEKENARLRAKAEPKAEARATKVEKPKPLRDKPKQLSTDEVKAMFAEKGFYDSDWNKEGKGITHQYEAKTINGGKVVQDQATCLMWQQSGSSNSITFANAEAYVRKMNSQSFAGFSDWRLPTLEEVMSLMEREQKNGLYIDPIFDRTQLWIWTGDKASASSCWVAGFTDGYCFDLLVVNLGYVRLVR